MPQATDALRALMNEWFGDPIDDGPPTRFLLAHGFTERFGFWRPPVPAHNVSREELACLRFLVDEWDHDFVIEHYRPEEKFANGNGRAP